MKKAITLVLAVLLCTLTLAACGEKNVAAPELTFARGDEMPVKLLSFSGETGTLENAGILDESAGLLLSGEYLNGTPEETDGGYTYAVPEAYFTLRKRENVDGILVYWGAAYAVGITDDGKQMVYTLDETLQAQTWTEFYNRALRWQKADGETSGVTGLK
ncbi:MAG: hypothetical protein J6I98_01740 [Clostridia bacterium]|nr:hypothetical protein [Clostridia bacterium]